VRPYGLRATQFTILQVLSLAGEVTQGQLGHILVMDSTTLTRTLAIMTRRRWITRRRGRDKREWQLQLSRTGALQLERALPAWANAQQLVKEQMDGGSEQLMKLANDLTNAITVKEDRRDE